MKTYRKHKLILLFTCLLIILVLGACTKAKEAEKIPDPVPQVPVTGSDEPLPIELFDWISKPFADFKTLYGEPVRTVNSEMTGLPIAEYKDLEVNLQTKNATQIISGFSLVGEKQTDPAKYSIKGVTFELDNRQVLDGLGIPVNGGRTYLCYSENFELWWKFDFDSKDQMLSMGLFSGVDQKDRTFVDWR